MSSADKLLDIITDLDDLMAQLEVDGLEGYVAVIEPAAKELYWLYKDMIKYE